MPVSYTHLAHLTGYTLTRGVLCAMRRPQLPDAEAVCAGARRVAVLEGVADSTNVGALFRSAAALGVDAILATPTCCDPFCRRAVRVSMGTVFQVPWTYIGDAPGDWPERGDVYKRQSTTDTEVNYILRLNLSLSSYYLWALWATYWALA